MNYVNEYKHIDHVKVGVKQIMREMKKRERKLEFLILIFNPKFYSFFEPVLTYCAKKEVRIILLQQESGGFIGK